MQSPRHDAGSTEHTQALLRSEQREAVTAGNASQLSDGASAHFYSCPVNAQRNSVIPLQAHFPGVSGGGLRTRRNGHRTSVCRTQTAQRQGLKIEDIDLWELNEAFAAQVIYCRDRLGIPMDKLNVNGGSISIGHPFGMTGSRMVGTMANEMKRRKSRYGVVTMCVGGGQGAAGLFERPLRTENQQLTNWNFLP